MRTFPLLSLLATSASAFAPTAFVGRSSTSAAGIVICEGVEFDTISREWRCKWSPENEKASLVEAQKALESVLPTAKAVDGVQGVQRVVCGGCVDFKVVTTLSAENFAAWEEKGFAPEGEFLDKLRAIDGLSQIETQTYTNMPM